jgi:hypothetical protein
MPKAVAWYRFYCGLAAVLNFGLVLFGVAMIAFSGQWASETVPKDAMIAFGGGIILNCALFGVLNVWIPKYRGNTAWGLHLVNLCFGIASCVLLPVALPVLVAWSRPEVKAYYAES